MEIENDQRRKYQVIINWMKCEQFLDELKLLRSKKKKKREKKNMIVVMITQRTYMILFMIM